MFAFSISTDVSSPKKNAVRKKRILYSRQKTLDKTDDKLYGKPGDPPIERLPGPPRRIAFPHKIQDQAQQRKQERKNSPSDAQFVFFRRVIISRRWRRRNRRAVCRRRCRSRRCTAAVIRFTSIGSDARKRQQCVHPVPRKRHPVSQQYRRAGGQHYFLIYYDPAADIASVPAHVRVNILAVVTYYFCVYPADIAIVQNDIALAATPYRYFFHKYILVRSILSLYTKHFLSAPRSGPDVFTAAPANSTQCPRQIRSRHKRRPPWPVAAFVLSTGNTTPIRR